MTPAMRALEGTDIAIGAKAEFEREIREEDVLRFAESSGDWNPLHVDPVYAAASKLEGRLVHGAFQVGLASALVGMSLPGPPVLLASVQARFPAPLYFPCRVHVRGEIVSWDAALRSGSVKVGILDAGRRLPTAEIFMGFTSHETRRPAAALPVPPVSAAAVTDAPLVIVTGATGGLGAAIAARLAGDHTVLALGHTRPLPEPLAAHPRVTGLHVDLAAADWRTSLEAVLGDRPVFAIVHAAWPGAPRGGLLAAPDETIEEQVRFGTVYTVRLARFLFGRVGPAGGRLIVVSSIWGSHRPNLSLAAYSLGKATLESAVKLLAPEMARRGVTVNAVCPALVPVGMHKNQSERWIRMKASLVPLGRLCRPEDVGDVVRFLLSPGASFVSGELIELSGGQL